jgi:predicted Zn-dependent protease
MTESRNPPPSSHQLLILAGIFGGFILMAFALLSWLINIAIGWIPVQVEQQIGRLIVPVYEQQAYESVTQTQLNQRLDELEGYLESPLHENRDYRVLYVPNDTVNAIAIPGDVIVIYQGLLEQLESDNELTMILGHELGHFDNRDHLRRLGKVLLVRIAIATLLGNPSGLESLVVDAVTLISNTQYSQSQEIEADRFGLDLLYETYGHVAGATDFFQDLAEGQPKRVDFFSTHPNPQKRIEVLKNEIEAKDYPVKARSPLTIPIKSPKS